MSATDLFIVRHAIAHERDASRWPDDGDRPLTEQGIDRFRRVARALGRLAPRVELLLSSPLTRAWQTAQMLAEDAGWPSPTQCEELEPDRKPGEVVDVLRSTPGPVVALVGHEPHLGELMSYLLTGSEDGANFELRKGGVARMELDQIAPGHAELHWLVTPKIMRAVRG